MTAARSAAAELGRAYDVGAGRARARGLLGPVPGKRPLVVRSAPEPTVVTRG